METNTVRNRKQKSSDLRRSLSLGNKVKHILKFNIGLPDIKSHKGHSITKVSRISLLFIQICVVHYFTLDCLFSNLFFTTYYKGRFIRTSLIALYLFYFDI